MSALPLFFGFVFGAAIGTIATAASGQELHEQAVNWFENIQRRWDRRKAEKKETAQEQTGTWREYIQVWLEGKKAKNEIAPEHVQQPAQPGAKDETKLPWWSPLSALQMTKIEVLAIFAAVWAIGLLWAIFFLPAWEDRPHVQYILGSLVGAAAAPWIWLHFSRDLESSASTEQGPFDRYRFMTYMLGAALLVAVLQPYLGKLLPRANKIEGFGVAFNFAQPRGDHASNVLQVGQATTSAAGTAGRLSVATRKAHLVATGRKNGELTGDEKTLADIQENMQGFGDLSLIDRDRVYVAYFYHERNGTADSRRFPSLKDYVTASKASIVADDATDAKFLADLSDLTHCIALYAERLRDFRLFLVNSEPFLQSLLVNVSTNWTIKDDNAQTSVKSSAQQRELKLKVADKLAEQIVLALKTYKAGGQGNFCSDASKLTDRAKSNAAKPSNATQATTANPDDVSGVGKKTPYPAYQIAHYMAAIDSVESGVLILRDWLLHQKRLLANGLERTPEQEWYAIRAMLASSQLPGLSNAPRHRSLVQFQQQTTDRMGAMLGVGDAATWRSLCRKLRRQNLHAHIGRYLAMTYADERNFLFELLLPEDLGVPPPGDPVLKSTLISPATYLQEAEAIVEKPECFSGVPRFDRKLLGQYSLNLAQLRLAVRVSASENERPALTKAIQADLEAAKQLGDSEEGEILDLLREPNEFTPQRERLARLKQKLDNEGGKD